MNRIALDLGFIKIYWYSIMIILGMAIGLFIAFKEVKRHKLNLNDFENMIFYTIIIALLGARIYYVLFNLDYYLDNPKEILMVWNGGLAIHGGIIASIIFILIYTKKHKLNFIKMLDICAPSLLIGQVLGRWGNFFNQEAHGGEVSRLFLEKLNLPEFIINGMYINGTYYHPTFLYESIFNLICFIILIFIRKNKKIKTGFITGIYLMWYGIVRFFIESLRTDALMLGSLRIAQIVSILMFIIGLILIITSVKREKYNKE